MFTRASRLACLLFVAASAYTVPALAYVGPGAGLTAIGTMVAVIAAILLAVVGFVWYPLKRVMRKKRAARTGDARVTTDSRDGIDDSGNTH
ncbi:hypothetical protein [Halomonas maura]|uniref:hypothetical protein n=1 Tax=Halomonas maura TaxID=117606 RepID=UPI0025B2F916|nr:hypothetical protein [Halomonas maura]MDN3554788.1 hypothetical protein [Halomonas maura]